ncbi:electron transport complex subunit RsxC [Candidatus Contubernalis alkaliaceticus]|uniref:electron transport complex subunit RsxC n=1 Tax=Candidatus Contubernalis alkaliaceticus TaxID=338645 RepID=UPI001F4C4019|nr:electron transport complex subunit RsxC [Candidatus Contubernalis alkalaceticus]UNC90901.1 electron transport complex subunit RsxC [Candidatus Contubernalis alkalaceticus]
MTTKTFKGGTHPPHDKPAASKPIVTATAPSRVVIPLSQHSGAPCEPLVKVGDEVKMGQKIGDVKAFISAPVHSSVSGKVVEIAPYFNPGGSSPMCVVIESDGKDIWAEDVKPNKPLEELTGEEIIKITKEAGIVGLGGAAFPTHVKLIPPEGGLEALILNGAECEPYLTCDHRLMVERAEDLIYGTKAMMKALQARKCYIGIEVNKPDAIAVVREAIGGDSSIEVVELEVKYPQGSGKQLVTAVMNGMEVPSGKRSTDVGVQVSNTGTAIVIADAIKTGRPLIDTVITVAGSGVNENANLLVRVGTIFTEIVEQCGGVKDNAAKIIMGGPMMGGAVPSLDFPICKATSGVLILTKEESVIHEILPCIKCGRCVNVCPAFIMPNFISNAGEQNNYAAAKKFNVDECIECGSCAFVCPAKRPIVQWIRLCKAEIRAMSSK